MGEVDLLEIGHCAPAKSGGKGLGARWPELHVRDVQLDEHGRRAAVHALKHRLRTRFVEHFVGTAECM